MSKRKSIIIMLVVFLTIGFAAVSTTLVLNGILAIGENKDDFNIIFTKAKLNGVNRNNFISEDKKHINFISNELKTLEDKAILTYEVTNTSRNYDADVSVTCSAGTTELITFEYTPHQMEVASGETKTGSFTASMFKVVDEATEVPIECTLTATAKERVDLGEEYIEPFSRSSVMMRATNDYSNPQGMWAYRSNITRTILEDKLIPHETTEDLIFDVSDKQDKSVMAYLVPNGETLTTNKDSNNNDLGDTKAYNLYIQGDTGIIANGSCYYMFGCFNNLLEIENLQFLDTSNVTSMGSMFFRCVNMTFIDLSNFDTRKVKNMSSMFCECYKLKNIINIHGFDTSNVTDMYRMFNECNSLISLDVSDFDTSKVTSMAAMFRNCFNLNELDVSNFDTRNATQMFAMFRACYNLGALDVSNFDTSNVASMASMFDLCKNITSLDLSNFNTTKVTTMASMFNGCSELSSIEISNFDTSNVTTMQYMFSGCSIKKIDLSNFDTSKVTDMSGMFEGCSELTELDLSNFNTSSLKSVGNISIDGMFQNCISLTNLDISGFTFISIETYNKFFMNMPANAIIKVKDTTAQEWILALTGNDRPSSWTTENIIIAS